MKHDGSFGFIAALPDAPLAMPRQMLERRRPLLSALRAVFGILTRA